MFTQDAGATWATQIINDFGDDGCLFRLSAIDCNHAWTVGYGGLFKLDLGHVNVNEYTLQNNPITFYPNPAKEIVHINTTSDVEKIQLIDISGQIVIEQNTFGKQLELNTSKCEPGIYLIKLYSLTNTITQKLVIE
jgi:hypothetical protein